MAEPGVAGPDLTVTLLVSNEGPDDAAAVEVSDALGLAVAGTMAMER